MSIVINAHFLRMSYKTYYLHMDKRTITFINGENSISFARFNKKNLELKTRLLSQKKRRKDFPFIFHPHNSYLSGRFPKWKAAHEVCPHHLGAPDRKACYQTIQTVAGSKQGSLSRRHTPPGLFHMRQ